MLEKNYKINVTLTYNYCACASKRKIRIQNNFENKDLYFLK